MEEFLLLGHVPGTQLVITFWMWQMVFNSLLAIVVAWQLLSRRKQIALALTKLQTVLRKRYELLKSQQTAS